MATTVHAKSTPVKTNPDKFRPAKVNPERPDPVKVRPLKQGESKPKRTQAPPLPSKLKPPPPERVESPPPKWTPAIVPKIPPPLPKGMAPPFLSNTIPESPWLKSSSSSPSLTKSSLVSSSITQKPPTLGPSSGPSTQSGLKPSKSASNLLNGYIDDKPGSTLAISKNYHALNKQNVEPPQSMPNPSFMASTSTLGTSIPGLRPRKTPLPSSLLNNKPTQFPPPKVEKPGFFARLFGFGKPKPKEREEPKPTIRPSKLVKPTRPMSTVSSSPVIMPTPALTSSSASRPVSVISLNSTRPLSVATMDLTAQPAATAASDPTTMPTPNIRRSPVVRSQPLPQQDPSVKPAYGTRQDHLVPPASPRQRAVLVKKPPNFRSKRHDRPSVSTCPDRPRLPQNPGHSRFSSYPQVAHLRGRDSFASFTSDLTTTTNASNYTIHSNNPSTSNYTIPSNTTNYATPSNNPNTTNYTSLSNNPNYADYNCTNTTITSPYPPIQTYGDANRSYDTNRMQDVATPGRSQYPRTSNHSDRPTSYTYGDHFGPYSSGYQPLAVTPGLAPCSACNKNPQYLDPTTGETSPYCSDVCQASVTVAAPQVQQATCRYQGCTRPAVMYSASHYWNYCSESHEYFARKGCIHCRQAKQNGTQLCKECDEAFKQRAPTIIPVPKDHDAFWSVVDQFTESWTHPTQCPDVQAVFKVALTQYNLHTYLGYRDTLEYYGQFTAQGKLKGNERILWHGTRRGCNLGEMDQTNPCTLPKCSLCSIIRGSFDISKLVTNMPVGRFGTGIYASTKASKADTCSVNGGSVVSPWKALLLNNVAAGHECVMYCDDTTLTAPPQGYNSVYGGTGDDLDYDELVVYTSDAIRPTWLVMYL